MKITIIFRGSVFNQKEPIHLELQEQSTINLALMELSNKFPRFQLLLFKNNSLRDDILLFVDRLDVKSMNLLEMPLVNNQVITILPLAHGGNL